MRCPKCGTDRDKVIDSRSSRDGALVRRRRECLNCQFRFTTVEGVVPEELKVIKRNGEHEDFDRAKLRRGIVNACYKRPVSGEQIDQLVNDLSLTLNADFDREVSSAEIGERVMKKLYALDQVAFVRFASVYRKFEAARDFINEIKGMKS